MIETGNIIHSLTSGQHGMFNHCGIVMADDDGHISVIHNTPECGHPVIDTLERYAARRPITGVTPLTADADYILEYYRRNCSRSFNLVTYNCEHFAYGLYGHEVSPTVKKYLWGCCILAACYLLLKK